MASVPLIGVYILLIAGNRSLGDVDGIGAGGPAASGQPAAIRTDAVPPIPAELEARVKRYQDIRGAAFLDWHPDGGILIRSRIEAVDQLYRVPSPGMEPIPLTRGEEPVATGRCLPDGRVLLTQGKGGDEIYQILLLPRASAGGDVARPLLLTDGRSRNLIFPPDRAGGRLPFSSTRRNGRDGDLHLLSLPRAEDPRGIAAAPSPLAAELLLKVDDETWSVDDWSPDGGRLLLDRYVSANESHGYVLSLADRRPIPLPSELETKSPSGGATRAARTSLRFGPGGRSVFLASDARSEFRELVRIDLESGQSRSLTPDLPWDVEEIAISPDERLLAFCVNAGGASRLFLLPLEKVDGAAPGDPAAGRQEIPIPASVASGLKFSTDSASLGFTLVRASLPGEAWSWGIAPRQLTRWTASHLAGFAEGDFVDPEEVHCPSFDGRVIPTLLYIAPNGKARSGGKGPPANGGDAPRKRPVVIYIHGGPESQSRPAFNSRVQFWARELGAAVLVPNVRGSTGYGKTFALLDNGLRREDSVRDLGALLDWIAARQDLDAGRVAVVGASYGGFMVLAALVEYGQRLRAGVDAVGISNLATFLENTSPYRRELRRAEYGDERDPEMRRFFERISPGPRVGGIRSALLVIHGENDPRVPISETRSIVSRARSSGQPVWTLYAANEGHGFVRRENADYEAAVTAMFLKKFLE